MKWCQLLQSITMPTKKNFLPHSSLAPAHSPYQFLYTTCKTPIPFSSYASSMTLNCTSWTSLFPSHVTGMSLNCMIPFLDPSSNMTLNCTVLISVQWTTCFLAPPHHLSHITFIEDTNDMQHKVTCPTLQIYPHDKSCRGPDGLVACAPTCYITDSLESDSAEHYSCSNPSSRHPHYHEHYTYQIAFNRHSLNIPLDALDGHSSLLWEDT
jgi:hypothetical protein